MLPASPKSSENLFSDDIIAVVGPTYEATVLRDQIFTWIRENINSILSAIYPTLTCNIYMYGSVPLKTFLSDSDIDISVVISDTFGIAQPTLCTHIHQTYFFEFTEIY